MITQSKNKSTEILSPNTRRKFHVHLKYFFEYCIDMDWIAVNPMRKIRAPRAVSDPSDPIPIETLEQIQGELSGVWRDIFTLFMHTGRRAGELLRNNSEGWRPAVYEPERNRLRVWMHKTSKTCHSPVVSDEVREIIERYVNENQELHFPVTAKDFALYLKVAVKGLAVKCTLQDLRIAYGARIYESNNDIYMTASLLGNTVRVCEKHYVKPSEQHREAAAKLALRDSA